MVVDSDEDQFRYIWGLNRDCTMELELRMKQLEADVGRMKQLLESLFNMDKISTLAEQKADNNKAVEELQLIPPPPTKEQSTQTEADTEQTKPAKSISLSTAMIEKPTYSGRSLFFTAAEFVQRYDTFLEMSFGVVGDDFRLKYVCQCLIGPARLWYRALQHNFVDWTGFVRMFLRRFWSQNEQYSFEQQISFGSYETRSRTSRMSDYFLLFVNKARNLDKPPTEADFIKRLSSHFPVFISSRMVHRRSILEAYEFLVEEDRIIQFQDKLDRDRGKDQHATNNLSSNIRVGSGGEGCNGPP